MTLVLLAGAWLLGTLAGALIGGVWWPGAAAMSAAGGAASALEGKPKYLILGLLAAGLFIGGAVRYVDRAPSDDPGGIARYNGGPAVRFRALVADEPEVRGTSQRARLSVREVYAPASGRWEPSSGGVLLRRGLFPRHRYGDLLELEGELETPPSFSKFDYREQLARQGISSLIAYPEVRMIARGQGEPALAALHDARRRLGDALGRALPEPQAALAQAILLGQRAAIPAELIEDLNATGTSHLIAISGYNVSLVAALVIASLAWLIGRRPAGLLALAAIAGYTLLTGAPPTVVRAAIMGGLFVLATLVGRPTSGLATIALAAAVMTGWTPLVVYDVSFQLSFAAIAGLVYLAPLFQARGAELLRAVGLETEAGGLTAFLLENTALTMGAVAATLPIIALNFERVSAVAPLANLLAVPAFGAVLACSALTAAAGAAWSPAGQAVGWFAWAMLSYLTELTRLLADLPFASFEVEGFGRWHAVGSYLALGALAWWLSQRGSVAPGVAPERLPTGGVRLRPAWLLAGGLTIAAALAWWGALTSGGEGRLRLSVLDVGQGDAILLETPAGQRVLIDGGPSGQALLKELGEALPFWERSLDLVVLTHAQEDHLAGLVEVSERYEVARVLATPLEADTAAYHEWRELIRGEGNPYHQAHPGQWIDLGHGARLTVLGPNKEALATGEANDGSLVLRVTYGRVSFLLTGDIESGGEAALVRSGANLRSTVLKVPHHGAATSTSAPFVRAVRPAVAVVSVGAQNRFGHPSARALDRLGASLVFRTDEHGTVRLETDGRRLWVERER